MSRTPDVGDPSGGPPGIPRLARQRPVTAPAEAVMFVHDNPGPAAGCRRLVDRTGAFAGRPPAPLVLHGFGAPGGLTWPAQRRRAISVETLDDRIAAVFHNSVAE